MESGAAAQSCTQTEPVTYWNIIAPRETNGKDPTPGDWVRKRTSSFLSVNRLALCSSSRRVSVLGYVSKMVGYRGRTRFAPRWSRGGALAAAWQWLGWTSTCADYDSQWFDDNPSNLRWSSVEGPNRWICPVVKSWPSGRPLGKLELPSALTRVPLRGRDWLGLLDVKTLQVTLPSKRETSPLSFAGAHRLLATAGAAADSPALRENRLQKEIANLVWSIIVLLSKH